MAETDTWVQDWMARVWEATGTMIAARAQLAQHTERLAQARVELDAQQIGPVWEDYAAAQSQFKRAKQRRQRIVDEPLARLTIP